MNNRETIDDFLAQRSLALVGVSRDGRTGFGNAVRKELSEKGYTLYVVHPEADRIADAPCAHSLAEVAPRVGGVVLVTPPAQTAKLVEEAAAAGIRRVWMQQGAESDEAIAACDRHGIAVVHHECILMFAEPTAWFHRAHRWARGAFGELPAHAHPDAPHDRSSLERKLMAEVAATDLPDLPVQEALVTEEDLRPLPAAAQRFLRFMHVVGRPRDRSLLMRFEGRFLFGDTWVPCECAQYNTRAPIARFFHMRLRLKGLVPTYVRDLYLHGRGHMLGKVLDAVAVVDDASEAVSTGECVTWLNDAVLMAPSMLLVPEVEWSDAGDDAFEIALRDGGRTVRARVHLDERGAPYDFITQDRFYAPPGSKDPPARAEWHTPVEGWREQDGRCLPSFGRAVWRLPSGPLSYVELGYDPNGLELDVPPRAG